MRRQYKAAAYCEHANECPSGLCACPSDCACREHMCWVAEPQAPASDLVDRLRRFRAETTTRLVTLDRTAKSSRNAFDSLAALSAQTAADHVSAVISLLDDLLPEAKR